MFEYACVNNKNVETHWQKGKQETEWSTTISSIKALQTKTSPKTDGLKMSSYRLLCVYVCRHCGACMNHHAKHTDSRNEGTKQVKLVIVDNALRVTEFQHPANVEVQWVTWPRRKLFHAVRCFVQCNQRLHQHVLVFLTACSKAVCLQPAAATNTQWRSHFLLFAALMTVAPSTAMGTTNLI